VRAAGPIVGLLGLAGLGLVAWALKHAVGIQRHNQPAQTATSGARQRLRALMLDHIRPEQLSALERRARNFPDANASELEGIMASGLEPYQLESLRSDDDLLRTYQELLL
jgi:hypothetical protein